jgi:putative RNA 2'-phosphotransferase
MSTNNQEISKLISYWLRHNPADANLFADDFGWVGLTDLLNAIKEKGVDFKVDQLQKLNLSFDKIRWEFDIPGNRIRATHGHSYPVVLSEKAEIPPKVLYHGTAVSNIDNILKHGLKPMKRQFVHLSSSVETAFEVGKRHGKPIVVEIDITALLQQGTIFYKTSDNVWLTSEIPSQYLNIFGPKC